ncbi:MAG TPA: SdpI family protein [Candidatus Limnocylindrales bacterium]|nr:SdpI family protein [Candidatus Limnocylindrales bacterium]
MNLRRFYLISGIALTAMLGVSAWGLAQVGPDATVPTHWNIQGEVDGYGSAWFAFLMIPAVTAGIVGLMALIPRIEPRRENLRRSAAAYRTLAITLVLLMTVIHLVVVIGGIGVDVPVGFIIGMGIGVLFLVTGNVLTTVRSNFMFGVRTPWTLSSERSWDRTHRLVGRLFVVTGITMIVLALTGILWLVMGVMLVMIAVTLVAGYWYSYRQWQADPDHRPTGDAA